MDMNHLAIDIYEWAEEAMPNRTDQSMFLKMFGEIAELIDAGDDVDKVGDEVADCLIMLLDYARRKGVNPSVAVQRKLAILRTSTMVFLPSGVAKRVKP